MSDYTNCPTCHGRGVVPVEEGERVLAHREAERDTQREQEDEMHRMHVAQRERDAEQRQRQREDAVRGGTTPIRIVVQEPAEREAQMEREAEQRRALMEQRTREAERRDEKIRALVDGPATFTARVEIRDQEADPCRDTALPGTQVKARGDDVSLPTTPSRGRHSERPTG